MAEETGISWADMTFNPWIGCAKVSPACDGCYADALMGSGGRHKRAEWGGPGVGAGTRSRTAPSNWAQPRRWDKKAAAEGTRPFVFCASLADVFDNEVPHEWRRDLFDLIRATPNLTWLLLTKRPGMILKLFEEACRLNPDGTRWTSALPEDRHMWPRNAAIGCSVVNDEEADRDIPKLLNAKNRLNPAFAFLSMEPLLGDVSGLSWHLPGIDWIIAGGETDQGGHKARPMHPDWVRRLRDVAVANQVAFHFKQWGEWAPMKDVAGSQLIAISPEGLTRQNDGTAGFTSEAWMQRIGKAKSGRELDGRVWDERPFLEVVGQ